MFSLKSNVISSFVKIPQPSLISKLSPSAGGDTDAHLKSAQCELLCMGCLSEVEIMLITDEEKTHEHLM